MNVPARNQAARMGLRSAEALALQQREGFNELPSADRRTLARIVVEVLREPMLALLMGGGLVYLALGDTAEALILLVFAMLSILITVVQEARTERTLEALRDLTSPRALVIRDDLSTYVINFFSEIPLLRPQADPPSPEGPMPVADHLLFIATDTGDVPAPIRIYKPVPAQQGSWTCRYEIGWPEGMRAIDAAGNDPMQALVLAIHMIGAELYTSAYHRAGQLRDPGNPEGGYGFPVPNSLRDLLVGSDKQLF